MSILKNKYFILLAGALLLLPGILSEQFLNTPFISGTPKTYISNFETALNKKEKAATLFLNSIAEKFPEVLKNPEFYINDITQKGFEIFIFDKDSIVFWTSNQIKLQNINSIPDSEISIKKISNAWHLINRLQLNSRTYYSFFLIRDEYSYQNKYLLNQFSETFSLPEEFNLSDEIIKGNPVIKSINGTFLCSLIIPNQWINKKPDSVWIFLSVFSGLSLIFIFIYRFSVLETKGMSFWKRICAVLLQLVLFHFLFIFSLKGILPLFFSSHLYGADNILSSLGHLFILTFLFSWFVWYLINQQNLIDKISMPLIFLVTLFFLLILFYVFIIQWIINGLVIHSIIPFDFMSAFDNNLYTIAGLICAGNLFWVLFLITERVVETLLKITQNILKINLLLTGLMLLGCLILYAAAINPKIYLFLIVWSGIWMVLALVIINSKKDLRFFGAIMAFISLVTILTSLILIEASYEKDLNLRKAMAENMIFNRDPFVEFLLKDIKQQMVNDPVILSAFLDSAVQKENLIREFRTNYLNKYLNKISFEISFFDTLQKNRFGEEKTYKQLQDKIDFEADTVLFDGFYHLNDEEGKINYILKTSVKNANILLGFLFIEIRSKLFEGKLSFNELLVPGEFYFKDRLDKYSFALYKFCKLAYKKGSYAYTELPKDVYSDPGTFSVHEKKEFNHLVYNVDDNTLIVISKKDQEFWIHLLTFFGYLFLFFSLFAMCIGLIKMVIHFMKSGLKFELDFKSRIQYSILAIMIGLLVGIGGVTLFNIFSEYQSYHQDRIKRKTNAIVKSYEYEHLNIKNINSVQTAGIQTIVKKISSIHSQDINLFDKSGNLIASSEPKIFQNELLSGKINPEAFFSITNNNESYFLANEKIGKLNYISAYLPIRNELDEITAYLNMPYFQNDNDLKEEISTFLIALINIYVLLFVLLGFISLAITRQVVAPLTLIGQRFSETKLGKKNEPIIWARNDEIGSLVGEYNRMLSKLDESAQLLARSERESAWREMAKQIAHEIKNPLTPMKLGVQHFQRSWNDKSSDMEEKFKKFSSTLIQQIDNLTNIANAFSSFAKMPVPQNEPVDIDKVLINTVDLFSKDENIKIKYLKNSNGTSFIFADFEQIMRVFNNIINNAIQAVPDDRKGDIQIILNKEHSNYVVKIQDNGIGIKKAEADKIFEPNFTTKRSGMGLGLAMVKNIIETSNGKIWFESTEGVGTTFYITFPIYLE